MSAPFASDFRSDTVTKPTPAMRRAMAEAEVGDDVLDGDPTVRKLEERSAAWLGKDGALFVPSGTMANQVAAGVFARRGEEAIVERSAHVLLYEAGALAALHGLQTVTLAGERGALDPEAVRAHIRPDYVHRPRTALVCVEQTHMAAGGRVVPLENLRAVYAAASERGVAVHLDGARLPHAVVASGTPAEVWARCADSVSVCLSKGLGAPVGSIIAGSAEFVREARVVRKRLGGWMRQAGVIAAAGLVALETGVERLAEDHALARAIAETAHGRPGLISDPADVETNIVSVRIAGPARDGPLARASAGPGVTRAADGPGLAHAADGPGLAHALDGPGLARALGAHGIGVLAFERDAVRFVTHRDVGPADVEGLARALDAILLA